MYMRHTIRKKDGKVHRYWCLVRSVRVGHRVIQQTVAHLGELDEHGRVEARALARRLIGAPEQTQLFDDGSEHMTVPVRLKGIRIERSRRFGDVYLALALWRGTGHNASAKYRSEEHTSELQSHLNLVCRLLLEKKKIRLFTINECTQS